MSEWPDTLTRAIEPLPGGLDGLRARIAAEDAAVARAIEPLPGGLDALRERIATEAMATSESREVAPLAGGLIVRERIATEAMATSESREVGRLGAETALATAARDVEPLPGGLAALRARIAGESATWDVVAHDVPPLPGGLAQLRRTIRHEARARRVLVPVALASVLATAIALVIVTRSAPAHADRTAMKQLLGGAQPHPGAAALGLVDTPQLVTIAGDPRVPDQVVVFRWVQPRYAP